MAKFQLLSNRSVIALEGKDRVKFFQGLITNDLNTLTESKLLYSLMLTPQGRFLYDFFIFDKNGKLYIDHENKHTEEIIKKFTFYKLRADVSITNLTNNLCIAAFDSSTIIGNDYIFRDPRSPKLGFRVYIHNDNLDLFVKENSRNKFYSQALYDYMIPEPHQDMIQEKSFPLEYGIDSFSAISFTKGCYLGQELTARTKHRGVIRKKLYKLKTQEDLQSVMTGEKITCNGNKIGIFCSFHKSEIKALLRIEGYNNLSDNDTLIIGEKVKAEICFS